MEFDEVGGAIQPVEDDSSSTEGDGESITASEMDTDTVHVHAVLNFILAAIYKCYPLNMSPNLIISPLTHNIIFLSF